MSAPGQFSLALDKNLSTQVTFHYAGSRHADPQQLAWSICGLVRFGKAEVIAHNTSAEHELLIAGLRAFFEQHDRGTWPSGAPLFHYRKAGNAYAYIFETLAELLSLASSREVAPSVGAILAQQLRLYGAELMDAFRFADHTGHDLNDGARGWASGHHPHRTTPESWATASVFRYTQALRRLVGRWSSDDARRSLGARTPSGDLATLGERGATWDLGRGTVGGFLSTAFVHPARRAVLRSEASSRFTADPDEQVLAGDQARSAMLFGPPGTGKTKMVEAVAGAIGWDFIEITPAQFLEGGVDRVSNRADAIFKQMMELDRCVVLLDEIDEMIRDRSDKAGPLERFFTTTMLPRLAKLWDARRILFFVNTNNIHKVDSAIVRSQRFDAAVLVLPPGYETKSRLLKRERVDLKVTEEEVTMALIDPGNVLEAHRSAGWLALVRYDQMPALAMELRLGQEPDAEVVVEADKLVSGIGRLSRELSRLDWRDGEQASGQPATAGGPNPAAAPLPAVKNQFDAERRDPRMMLFAEVAGDVDPIPVEWKAEEVGGTQWAPVGPAESSEAWADRVGGVLTPDGLIHLKQP